MDANYYRSEAEKCREAAKTIQKEIEQLTLQAVEFDVQALAVELHAAALALDSEAAPVALDTAA
jgi:hypothetical protein